RTYTQFVIRRPRPLEPGEHHEYGIKFAAGPVETMRPYYVLIPLRRTDSFSVRIRFGARQRPVKLWRLNGVPPRIIDECAPAEEFLDLDSVGEARVEFTRLNQGLSYGAHWSR
nr:hypothetical protein [Micromonospora sp. DSM 115978]